MSKVHLWQSRRSSWISVSFPLDGIGGRGAVGVKVVEGGGGGGVPHLGEEVNLVVVSSEELLL
jgi:hypothetical protein